MNKFLTISALVSIPIIAVFTVLKITGQSKVTSPINLSSETNPTNQVVNPLAINYMRSQTYPGSDITIDQKVTDKGSYQSYIASFKSQGLTIYALLTIPKGTKPASGWPVIVFNHGYIPPEIYKTTERYVAYVDYFARNGYIVFKPDYRGNGSSDGQPEGAYYSPAYAIDDLNAIASVKKYKDANPDKIGVWGHSMGGNITLRDLVVNTTDIKAAVIWGGVVGSYDDLMNNWQRKVTYRPSPKELALRNRYRQNLIDQYGTPSTDPAFWNTIDPTFFIPDIKTPVQLHAGSADEEVPVAFSQSLYDKLIAAGKVAEFYTWKGADHNISGYSFNLAMEKSLAFFNKYLK